MARQVYVVEPPFTHSKELLKAVIWELLIINKQIYVLRLSNHSLIIESH